MIISSKKSMASLYKYEDDFIPAMTQHPMEFNFLVEFLLKKDIQSILIFGVDNAGMEYRIADAYHKANKKCFITGVDCAFRDTLKHSYAKILAKFSNVTVNFVRLNLSMPFPSFLLGKYEFTFIDADHAYESVKNDFELALHHTSRFIGFHDILMGEEHGGVKKYWAETKCKYNNCIESIGDGSSYGIGIVEL